MMDGVYFNLNHSGDYYNAIMNYARITPPAVKTNYVDIPGGDSTIDLTESVGGVRLNDGCVNFKFTFKNGKKDAIRMINDIHGKRMTITLDTDNVYEMEGRVEVTKAELENALFVVEAKATVNPYKTEKRTTIHKEEVRKKKDIILLNSRKPVIPTITVIGNIYLIYEDVRYKMGGGVYQIPEITMYQGINRFVVYGDGDISFEYRKGEIIC